MARRIVDHFLPYLFFTPANRRFGRKKKVMDGWSNESRTEDAWAYHATNWFWMVCTDEIWTWESISVVVWKHPFPAGAHTLFLNSNKTHSLFLKYRIFASHCSSYLIYFGWDEQNQVTQLVLCFCLHSWVSSPVPMKFDFTKAQSIVVKWHTLYHDYSPVRVVQCLGI